MLFEVFKDTQSNAEALVEEYIKMYKVLDEEGDLQKRIAELEKKIELSTKKKAKLLEYNVTGQLSDKDFISMNKQCIAEIEQADNEIMELDAQQNSKAEFKKHIDTIRHVLQEATKDAAKGIINKEFIDKYIDKIFITPENGGMYFEIKIFTGETTRKFLDKLRGRTGHTVKNVCPERSVVWDRACRVVDGKKRVVKYFSFLSI